MQKAQFQIVIALKTTPKSEWKSCKSDIYEYCHSIVYKLWNCKSKPIEDITWKTWSESWTSCWYHHQKQSSENNTNSELCETHACKIVRRFITRQLPSPMTNYFELLSHLNSTRNNKLLIALPKVRTKAAKNRFYYQGATIYNSLTRYIRMPENEFFKKMSM